MGGRSEVGDGATAHNMGARTDDCNDALLQTSPEAPIWVWSIDGLMIWLRRVLTGVQQLLPKIQCEFDSRPSAQSSRRARISATKK